MKKISNFVKKVILIVLLFSTSNLMAIEFPLFPGGGGTGITAKGSLIFTCNISEIGTTGSNSSSCTSTGSNSSSCQTSSSGSGSAVKHWESSKTLDSSLESILNNADTCAEAVEAAGNCQASGAGSMIIYNCEI